MKSGEGKEFQIVRQIGDDMHVRDYEVLEDGKRWIITMDVKNGEEVDRKRVMESKKGPGGRPPGGNVVEFYKVYRTNWTTLIRDHMAKEDISFHEVGVLFSLAAFLGWEKGYLVNPVTQLPISEKQLAELMCVSRSALHRTINALVDKGLVAVERAKRGAPNRIFLNPNVIYFGKYADPDGFPKFMGEFKPPIKVKRNLKATAKEG